MCPFYLPLPRRPLTPGGRPASSASSPRRSAVIGVCSATWKGGGSGGGSARHLARGGEGRGGLASYLQDHRVACCQCWGNLPGRHEERKVPGDDLRTHADGLVQRVGPERAVDGDCLAVNLVSPAASVWGQRVRAVGRYGEVKNHDGGRSGTRRRVCISLHYGCKACARIASVWTG